MRRREHRVGIVVVVKITRGWRDTYVYVGRNVIRNIKNYKRLHAAHRVGAAGDLRTTYVTYSNMY